MPESAHEPVLTHDVVRAAVEGPTAAIRLVTKLLPAGGSSDKVFPPTYAGGVYAVETRRIDGREVICVHLDSVQSQANRLEQALLLAYENGRLKFPLMVADFGKTLLPDIGRVTALDAPHRIADAIFRDSLLDGKPFRESPEGKAFEAATIRSATPLFDLCPTALVFGTWDSTGSKGGSGNKFPRALVSEIVGIEAVFGVRTSSRIDPLGIQICQIYEDKEGNWTADESKARRDPKGEPVKFGRRKDTKGKPSELNHGNVTPGFATYSDSVDVPDPLRETGETVRKGQTAAGGVTIAYALQTTVLSLPALRRLRFPDTSGATSFARDTAARTVLAALALAAVAHQREHGYDLRSRCLLVPADGNASFDLVTNAAGSDRYSLGATAADRLLCDAAASAKQAGLNWRDQAEVLLTPSDALVDLVQKSRAVADTGESEVV